MKKLLSIVLTASTVAAPVLSSNCFALEYTSSRSGKQVVISEADKIKSTLLHDVNSILSKKNSEEATKLLERETLLNKFRNCQRKYILSEEEAELLVKIYKEEFDKKYNNDVIVNDDEPITVQLDEKASKKSGKSMFKVIIGGVATVVSLAGLVAAGLWAKNHFFNGTDLAIKGTDRNSTDIANATVADLLNGTPAATLEDMPNKDLDLKEIYPSKNVCAANSTAVKVPADKMYRPEEVCDINSSEAMCSVEEAPVVEENNINSITTESTFGNKVWNGIKTLGKVILFW